MRSVRLDVTLDWKRQGISQQGLFPVFFPGGVDIVNRELSLIGLFLKGAAAVSVFSWRLCHPICLSCFSTKWAVLVLLWISVSTCASSFDTRLKKTTTTKKFTRMGLVILSRELERWVSGFEAVCVGAHYSAAPALIIFISSKSCFIF